MVHAERMSAVLSEFARNLATDFSIQSILEHLVERIVGVLPITAAGVTLLYPDDVPPYIAASNESALRFEQLQSELGEGPCLAAYQSGKPVAVPDLSADSGFPLFSPVAVSAGLRGVFAFPLLDGERRMGALDLYRSSAGWLGTDDVAAAQTLTEVAAAYLLHARARDTARATSAYFRHTATHDPLTGLSNRLMLQQRLENGSRRNDRNGAGTTILFVDLDRFKRVNDTYGHQVGDELLLAVAQRLAPLVRRGDTLARFSGDEFVFLCEDMPSPHDIENLAQRIHVAFSHPFIVAGTSITLTASIGTASAGPDGATSDQLLAQADIAMSQVKDKGGAGHQTFDLSAAQLVTERLTLERDLRGALQAGSLDLAYQPIVRTAEPRVFGVEALLRWTSPERGAVSPLSMVAAAEESSLITEVGAWVLERACRERSDWAHLYPNARLDMAVNISARQLMTPGFSKTVAVTLQQTGMDPTALVLEITESVLLTDAERAVVVLNGLKDLGVRLALDDFGTGYSSLSYLRQLPIDIVKIDQSFIAGMDHPRGGAIVEGVTTLAHALGLAVVAEGVETLHQHERITTLGCESAQGFFYARPMPSAEITDALGRDAAQPWRLPDASTEPPQSLRHLGLGA